jgi:proline dehydrogenase
MLPNAQALVNFSRHLTKNRPNAGSIPFPGCPHSSDLNILEKRTSTRQLDVIVSTPSDNDLFSAGDINELRELKEDLHRICRHAKKRGVRVIVDAEHRFVPPFTPRPRLPFTAHIIPVLAR